MIIIGVDPGSQVCGYGVLRMDGAHPVYVECGTVDAPKSWHRFKRLVTIGTGLQEVFADHGLTAGDCVAIEEGFVLHKNGALTLGEARCLPIYEAGKLGADIFGYSPATVKQAVTGSGKASKEHVAACIMRQLGLKRQPDPNATDALAVAWTCAFKR